MAIVLIAALMLVVVFRVSLGGSLRSGNPALALTFVPRDAVATASYASNLAMARSPAAKAQARELAIAALVRDPTTVAAFRTLGTLAAGEGDSARAYRLFAEAERLSRRDRQTQIWLIDYYQRRGDLPRMVHHFDIALRSSGRSWGILIPVLVATTADTRVLPLIRSALAQEPEWRLVFLQWMTRSAPSPDNAVRLSRGLLDASVPAERSMIEQLLQRLTAGERFDLAWQVYDDATGGNVDPSSLAIRNGDFESVEGFAPFDWSLNSDPELGAARISRPDNNGNALSLIAYNGRSGEVARQLLRLSPGAYVVQADVGAIPQDVYARPTIRVVCAGDSRPVEILRLRPYAAAATARRLRAPFSVPQSCRWQWLSVEINGQGPQLETNPWIDSLTINRAS